MGGYSKPDDINIKVDIPESNIDISNNYFKQTGGSLNYDASNDYNSSESIDFSDMFFDQNTETGDKLVSVDGYMILKRNPQEAVNTFGGQADHLGPKGYGVSGDLCDNYARAYCLYMQTGKIVSSADLGSNGLGLKRITEHPSGERKGQAQRAFELISNGQPCVIHVNSNSGKGHWLCVVGYKEGVTRETVTTGDFLVIDSYGNPGGANSATVIPCSANPMYCTDGLDNTSNDDPNEKDYQVVHFD